MKPLRVYLPLIMVFAMFETAYAAQPAIVALPTTNSVQVKIIDRTYYPSIANVSYEIRHWPDNALLSQGTVLANTIANDALGYPAFTIQNLTPNLWWPQDPQLYTITVKNTSAQQIGQTRFGFRTFTTSNRKFYLNGRPIFLRSNPINPPGRDLPTATGQNPTFIRAYLKLLKDANVNLIRTETDEWLNACDEMGIMVSQLNYSSAPGGSASTPPSIDYGKTAYRSMVLELINHPSVVIYILTNEVTKTTYDTFLNDIWDDIRLLDPTRLVIGNAGFGQGQGGEIYDHHRYLGWYYGNPHDWYELNETLELSDAANQPLTISEYVAAYTSDAGVFQTMSKQLATMLRWTGPAVDQRAAALEYQAELTKQAVEITRRIRTSTTGVAGSMPFTYFFGWASATKAEDLFIKPAYETMKEAFQPVLISPECWKRNLYAGDNLTLRLCVVNDDDGGRNIGASQAIVEVIKRDGTIAASGSTAFSSVPYYSNVWATLSIPLPQNLERGDYKVKCRLVESGNEISRNEFRIMIAPRDWTNATGLSVYLYDTTGNTQTALARIGVNVTKVSSLSTLPQNGILVMGEASLTASTFPSKAEVLAFLGRGGRIVCLRQAETNWTSSWLPVNYTMSAHNRLTYIHPIGDNSAIFKGLRSSDLRYWNTVGSYSNGAPIICPVLALLWPASSVDLESCRIWAACDQMLGGAAMLEIFNSGSSIIISQFRCVERVESDPAAARLLANLISYAASSDHPGPVDLTKKIRWNLEAFRTGAFASTKQGFLPHSKVYEHTGGSKGELGADHSIDGFTLVGNYGFNTHGWITPVPDPAVEGWGIIYGSISRSVTRFSLTAYNPSTSSGQIKLKLDGLDIGLPATVTAGQQRVIEWTINRPAGPVKVELRGDQDLVIKETQFK